MTEFSPVRSDAIRAELVEAVDAPATRRRRRLIAGVGVALAGLLAGAGTVAAAAGIWNPGVEAPEGVTPGTGIVSVLDGPVEHLVDGADRAIPLDPPAAATHVRAAIACTSPGTTYWGLDAGGNNPSIVCTEADLAPGSPPGATWMDFRLGDATVLYVHPVDGATSIVTTRYLDVVQTAWGVNDDGETYGGLRPDGESPVLQAAIGADVDGTTITGYIRDEDTRQQCPGAGPPTSPEQALEQQERCARDYPDGFDIPLYASDGVTRIGWFHIGG